LTLIDNSDAVKDAIREVQKKWLFAVGELLTSAIRPLIPVDMGNLKTSLDYQIDEETFELVIGVTPEYAIYVEFGTGEYAENGEGRKGGWSYQDPKTGDWVHTIGSKPQPYMRPGYESVKNDLIAVLEKYLNEMDLDGKYKIKVVEA